MGIKFTYEQIREEFIKKGCTLVSKKYEDCFKKLDIVCPNGHDSSVSFNNFRNHGVICATCSGRKKPSFEEILSIFKKEHYVLISTKYENCDSKLTTKCPAGHTYVVDFYHFFNRKQRCSLCSSNKKHTLNYVKEMVEKNGYSLISTKYKNSLAIVDLMCSKGHAYSPSFHSFKDNGSRCPICSNKGISRAEMELTQAIAKEYPNIKKFRDRRVSIENKKYIKGFEIDIYIPKLKKGIEFDGTYWHSFEKMRADPDKALWSDEDIRNYHEIKDEWFETKGIRILHIKEEEWKLNKESCIKRCLDFFSN